MKFLYFFRTSSRSILWNRISGFSVTWPFPSCSRIFLLVDGIYGSRSLAPSEIPWIRFHNTVDRRSFFDSSFPSTHGVVSSIYLLQRLNRLKISDRICHTQVFHLFIYCLCSILYDCLQVSIHSSATPVSVTVPPKYLFVIGNRTVYKVSKRIGRSEFRRSTISSQEITPSFSNGISWEYKVTNRIHSKEINQLIRIKHISFRLAHLSVSLKQPRMSKYLLWKWEDPVPSGRSASRSYGNGWYLFRSGEGLQASLLNCSVLFPSASYPIPVI